MELNLKIIHAENGQEAVNICLENKDIDLVFMDIKMPVLNGIEATRKIKAFRKELSIIAQIAYTTTEDREIAKQAGCDDFITKPIDSNILDEVINRYLVNLRK